MPDAIIVLANLMDRSGKLNDETTARLTLACDLLQENEGALLVPCGWAYRDDSGICIADAMESFAVRTLGVSRDCILPERASRDTVGDAIFTKRHLANPRRWTDIVVVTSAYHTERTRQIFSFVYGRPIVVAAALSPDTEALRAAEARSSRAFLTTFDGVKAGDDEAIWERLRTRHPFYNGEVYPAIPLSLSGYG